MNDDWQMKKDFVLQSPDTSFLQEVVFQLDAFWHNSRHGFTIQKLDVGTIFRRKVWQALCRIKPGQVLTYAELAKELATALKATSVVLANIILILFLSLAIKLFLSVELVALQVQLMALLFGSSKA